MHRSATLLLLLTISVFSSGMVMAQTSTVRGEASLMDLPGGQAVVLDVLSVGMNVEIMSVKGNWARIRIPATSEVGWVKTSALARADAEGEGARQVGVGMTGGEMEKVEGRVEMMGGGLRGIEQRVDNLLERLGDDDQAGAPQAREASPDAVVAMGPGYAPYAAVEPGRYRWHNQFVMGTYVRGGQNYYGLELSRALDTRGRSLLVARAQYGLGEARGKLDDFIDWTAGMNFSLFPEAYVIYPYFGAHFGMRHLLEDTLPDRHFFIAAPSLGVCAQLGGIFTLGVELRGLFRFESGHRRDDGMVGFNCGYKW